MVQSLLHVRDEKLPGTPGGTPSVGANIRDLNVELTNEITGAVLSSNQISLDAGTYEVLGIAPAFRGDEHRVYLYNITDASIEVVGVNNYSRDVGSGVDDRHQTKSVVRGRFTIGSTKVFELRHEITATSGGASGLGNAVGDGLIEIFAEVFIWEIVDDFDLLHVRDEKTANTDGGSSIGNTFHIRELDSVAKTNEITGASIAANQITLPAGTFEIKCTAPAWRPTSHRVTLYNVTNSIYTVLGINQYSRSTINNGDICALYGQFIIQDPTIFEIRHWINVTQATNGLGRKMNDGSVEVYTEALIRKLI